MKNIFLLPTNEPSRLLFDKEENKVHLQSMTDFVLNHPSTNDYEWQLYNHLKYAKFLTQPLKLEMFVPCDEDGNVLEEPIDIYYKPDFGCQKFPQECYIHDLQEYQKAKDKVLFKGFKWDYEDDCLKYQLSNGGIWFFSLDDLENENIETFGGIENKVELTETAIKQIWNIKDI